MEKFLTKRNQISDEKNTNFDLKMEDIEKLKREIQYLEIKAKNKLGIEDLKKIDFYELQGFKILSTYIVFENSSDRDRILAQFKKVLKFLSILKIILFVIIFYLKKSLNNKSNKNR